MKKEKSFMGYIDLMAIAGAELKTVGSTDCIVIPVKRNPLINISNKRDGNVAARLYLNAYDCEGKYGNSHYIRAGMSKKIMEQFAISEEVARKFTPILGNLKPMKPISSNQAQKPMSRQGSEFSIFHG